MQPLTYCVYVLYSHKDFKMYIGYTTNLERRLSEHHNGQSKSTAPRRPLELIFCEFYTSKQDAQRREFYFKSSPGRRALKIMLKETFIAMV